MCYRLATVTILFCSKIRSFKLWKNAFILDDEDDDLDEPDSGPTENEYEFPPQFMSNVQQLESER